MKNLYCPWRQAYIERPTQAKKNMKKSSCVFCDHIQNNNDEKSFILHRGKYSFVLLNRFPYNAGHLLIVPYKHAKDLSTLSKKTREEMMEYMSQCATLLQKTFACDGLNMGINLGKVAGAGIPGHIHIHVLPRWEGDTNFLPTLCDTKQISIDLHKIYQELKKAGKEFF